MPTSKALRQWFASLDGHRAARRRPGGRPGTSRRATPGSRYAPTRRRWPSRLRERMPQAPRRDIASATLAARATRRPRRAIRAELSRHRRQRQPSPERTCRSARRCATATSSSCASSMPVRDKESFLPATERDVLVPLEPRSERDRRHRVFCDRRGDALRGRPAWVVIGDLALHHDSNGLAAASPRRGAGPHRLPEQRRRRDLRVPAPGLAGERARSSRRSSAPRSASTCRTSPRFTGSSTAGSAALDELAGRHRDRPLLVEVPIDRAANVGVHDGNLGARRRGAGSAFGSVE